MRGTLQERFEAKYIWDELTDCMIWTGAKTAGGYGVLGVTSKSDYAHRIVLELLGIQIPNKMQVDHLCRNRACVNPEHLEIVTQSENLKRQADSNRIVYPHGHIRKYKTDKCRCETCKRANAHAERSRKTK